MWLALRGRLNVLLPFFLLPVLSTPVEAQNMRFQTNLRGGFALTGNQLDSFPNLAYYNTAGGTTLSSSADLILPAGSSIIKAYLYVEGYTSTKITSVKFRVPGGLYTTYNTTSAGFLGNPGTSYQQFMVDVTGDVPPGGYVSTVATGGDTSGSGRYSVADLAPYAINRGYGWALFVVYTNPNSKYRSVTIADNNASFGPPSNQLVILQVNNISVPAAGSVNAVVALTGSFGDAGIPLWADTVKFGAAQDTGSNLADPYTGSTVDVLNSSIAFASNNNVSADGGPAMSGNFTARKPYQSLSPASPFSGGPNWSSYYYDADILNASGILPNSPTPINVKLTQRAGSSDVLGSGSYAISVDIAAALLTKSVSPAVIGSGGMATYTFTIANTQQGAINLTGIGFTDNLPAGLMIASPASAVLSGGTGGTVTAVPGGNSVALSGLALNAGQTATLTVAVTNVPGQLNPSCAANPAAFTNGFFNITNLTPNLANGVTDQCLVVLLLPPAPVVNDTAYCQGSPAVPLTATGTGLLWYTTPTGGTGSPVAPMPSTAVPGTTTWYVSQTVGGLESPRTALNVTIYPKPVVVVTPPSPVICSGQGIGLTASGADSFLWAPAAGLDATTTAVVTASPAATTTYTVIGSDTTSCRDTAMITVTVHPKPVPPLEVDTVTYCQGAPAVPLTATGSGLLWYTESAGGTGSPVAPVPGTAVPDTLTWYVSQTMNGCESDRVPVVVIVYPEPLIDARIREAGGIIYLDARASGFRSLQYLWAPPYGLSCTDCPMPEAAPGRTTTYTVTVTNEFGCQVSDILTVAIDCAKTFLPNTFTPNGDGNNDRFYPIGRALRTIRSFRVYSRWGELVYEARNIPPNREEYGWDGTFKGAALKADVYVYVLEGTCGDGEQIFRKGDITLFR